MSASSPGGIRQPLRPSRARQASRDQPWRETIAFILRSMPLIVAAVSVIAASNYLAYLIGRKQVSYEELRRQVDRIVELVDQKRVEEELATVAPKQQQDKIEQTGSALTDLTTSTINGKTMVAPDPASARKPITASLTNDTAAPPSIRGVGTLPAAATKQRETHAVVHQRVARRQKTSPTAVVPGHDPANPAAAAGGPDVSLAGQ